MRRGWALCGAVALLLSGACGRSDAGGAPAGVPAGLTVERAAVDSMAGVILRYQGDGDYPGVRDFMAARTRIPALLQGDLDRLATRGIPVDIVFEQGVDLMTAVR